MEITKKHDTFIDALKGFLILLVVLGHCIGHDTSYKINEICYNYIYLFHMPLFVFISGYFSKISDKTKFWNGILEYVSIYVIYQIVKSLIGGKGLIDIAMYPAAMLWYLLALIVWRLVYYLVSNRYPNVSPIRLVALSTLLSLVVGFIPMVGRAFALSRIFVFAPFFFIGVSLQGYGIKTLSKRIHPLIAIFFICLPLVLLIVTGRNISPIVRGASSYYYTNPVIGFAGRFVYYPMVLMISVSVVRLFRGFKLLEIIGKDSLKYYIFHGIILLFMYDSPYFSWTFMHGIVYWILISVFLYFFNKTRLSDFLVNPLKGLKNSSFNDLRR